MAKEFQNIIELLEPVVDWNAISKELNLARSTVFDYRNGNFRKESTTRLIANAAKNQFQFNYDKYTSINRQLERINKSISAKT